MVSKGKLPIATLLPARARPHSQYAAAAEISRTGAALSRRRLQLQMTSPAHCYYHHHHYYQQARGGHIPLPRLAQTYHTAPRPLPRPRPQTLTCNNPFTTSPALASTFLFFATTREIHPLHDTELQRKMAVAADFEAVLKGKYPAKAHAQRVAEYMRAKKPGTSGVLYLEGQKTRMIEDNDSEMPFRQRRYFYYLTGCALPDASLAYDIATEKSTLFIPPIEPESVIWSGLPLSVEEALSLYDVDDVQTTDKANDFLAQSSASSSSAVWAIAEQVSPHITLTGFASQDSTLLKEAIEECRAVKDEFEVALTRKANAISTVGHTAVLEAVKSAKNERELEALFIQKSIANGSREQAYHSIVASGTAAATLHYVKNDEPLSGKLNLLLDAGGEYNCYASDITRTFPISGKFSTESRAIYDIVLQMQKVCINMLKEGVLWDDVHLKAHTIAIEGLLALGILKGNKEDILQARTSVAFFPHGLGHYLGMDTHDTGGHPNYQDKDTMFRYLRVRGALPAGSIITVEPGIYFCKFIIDPYLNDPTQSKFIDPAVLEKYWEVGGVRIEDNLLVTKDGYENLTTAVKEVDEMEKLINGGS